MGEESIPGESGAEPDAANLINFLESEWMWVEHIPDPRVLLRSWNSKRSWLQDRSCKWLTDDPVEATNEGLDQFSLSLIPPAGSDLFLLCAPTVFGLCLLYRATLSSLNTGLKDRPQRQGNPHPGTPAVWTTVPWAHEMPRESWRSEWIVPVLLVSKGSKQGFSRAGLKSQLCQCDLRHVTYCPWRLGPKLASG